MRGLASRSAFFSLVSVGVLAAGSALAQEPAPAPAAAPPTAVAPPPPSDAHAALPPPHAEEDKPAPNSVFAEGLGAGLAYSINYERRVIDDLGVRVGFSYMSFSATAGSSNSSSSFMTFPITAEYLGIRSGKHALELGGGMTLAYSSASSSSLGYSASGSGVSPFGVAFIGYRLHPVDHAGFQFRVGAMALAAKGLSLSNKDPEAFGVLPWLYLSFGAGF